MAPIPQPSFEIAPPARRENALPQFPQPSLSLFAIGMIGLGMLNLIPAWIPLRPFWAYLTGAGHIAAGLAILLSVVPRLAAAAEAAMLSIITVLVWVPAILAAPRTRLPWTAFFISWAITAAVWVVAQNIQHKRASTTE